MGKANLDTKQAVDSVKALITQIEKLNNQIGKIGGTNTAAFNDLKRSMDSLKDSISTIKKTFTAFKNEVDRNTNVLKTNSKRLTKNSKEVNRLGNLIKTNSKNTRQNTTATKKNTTAQNKNNTAVTKGATARGKSNKSMVKSVALGNLWAMGVKKILELGKKAIVSIAKLTVKFESLGFAIEKISKTTFETGRSWIFLMELNQSFGASLVSTTERWLKFRAAARQSGITLKETKDIFRSMTKASAVLGLATDEMRGVYLALEQMLSKGKVTTEELRRQLGERLPGAMGIMAGSMGVTISELDKMMKKGEVLSAEVLPNFAKAMEDAYGIENVKRVETLNASLGRLDGTWEQFVLTITEGDSAIKGIFNYFLNAGSTLINNFIKAIEDGAQKLRRLQTDSTGDVSDKIDSDARASLAISGKLLKTDIDLNLERAKTLGLMDKLSKAGKGNSDEYKKLDAVVADLTKQSNAYNVALDNQKVIDAPGRIEELKEEFKSLGTSYEHMKDLVESPFTQTKSTLSLYPSAEEIAKGEKDLATVLESSGKAMADFKAKNSDNEIQFIDKIEVDEDIAFMVEEYEQLMELLETPIKTNPIDPDGDSKRSRKPRAAKLYTDDSQDEIDNLKKVNVEYKVAYEERATTLEQFESFSEKIQENKQTILDLERQDEITALNTSLANKKSSWDATMRDFKGSEKDKARQQAQYDIQMQENEKEHLEEMKNINSKYILADAQLEFESNEKKIDAINDFYDRKRDLIKEQFAIDQALRDKEASGSTTTVDGVTTEVSGIAEGSTAAETHRIKNLEAEYNLQQELLAVEIQRLEMAIIKAELQGLDVTDLKKQLNAAKEGIGTFKTDLEKMYTGKGAWENWAKDAIEVQQAVAQAVDAIFERRIELIDRQIDKETEMFDKSLELAKNDEAEKKIIERNKEKRIAELEKKKKKEQIKQAKFDKANALSQAVISGTLAIIGAFATQPVWLGIAMGSIMSTIVTAQIAQIAAQPIPTFATGGIMENDGVAQINDGGALEYVERDGNIFTTPKTNALVNLKKDDIIHKDFEAFKDSNHSFFLDNGILGFGKSNMDEEIIVNAIERGFSNAKVNNKITVLNKVEDISYREQMSNWN